jgi:hypothetical protein
MCPHVRAGAPHQADAHPSASPTASSSALLLRLQHNVLTRLVSVMAVCACTRPQVRHLMFTWSLTNGIIDTLADLEAALAAAVCNKPPRSALQRAAGWARPLLPLLGGVHLACNWAAVLGRTLPAALRQGSEGERSPTYVMSCYVKSGLLEAGRLCCLVLAVKGVAGCPSLH